MSKQENHKELLVYTRQMLEEMTEKYNSLKDEAEANFKAMDAAYKEQEQMLKELKRWLDSFPYAFEKLIEHAGKITTEDVTYHINLISKIMEHKFGYKSKTEEL